MASDDPYRVLGLPPTASQSDIRRAWLVRARKLHPDKCAASGDAFQRVKDAYELLADPARKQRLDLAVKMRSMFTAASSPVAAEHTHCLHRKQGLA
jgi:curved DNA-binding protein CbpA